MASIIGSYGFGKSAGLAEKARRAVIAKDQAQTQLIKQKGLDKLQIDSLKKQLDAKIELQHQKQVQDALALPEAPAPQTYIYPIVTSWEDNYDYGQCTWGVASWIKVPQDLGNANMWAVNAQAEGFTVSPVPLVGAVAQTTAGVWGHVALVIGINGNQVEIREMNAPNLGVTDERWTDVSAWSNFIYF